MYNQRVTSAGTREIQATPERPLSMSRGLIRLEHGRPHLNLGAKHPIPEPARDSKAILVVSKVVLEVVLLELLVVRRKPIVN